MVKRRKAAEKLHDKKKDVRFTADEYAWIGDRMKELGIRKFSVYARLRLLSEGELILSDHRSKGEKGQIRLNEYRLIQSVNRIGHDLGLLLEMYREKGMDQEELLDQVRQLSAAMVEAKAAFLYPRKKNRQS